jgi:hypothetical protein
VLWILTTRLRYIPLPTYIQHYTSKSIFTVNLLRKLQNAYLTWSKWVSFGRKYRITDEHNGRNSKEPITNCKAIIVTGHGGLLDDESSRIPHFPDNRVTDLRDTGYW